jgi:hypothetical protein
MLIGGIIENLREEELNHGLRLSRTRTAIEQIVNPRSSYRSKVLGIPQCRI